MNAAVPTSTWWRTRTRSSARQLARRLVPSVGLIAAPVTAIERAYLDTYDWGLFNADQLLLHERDPHGEALVLRDRARKRSDVRVPVGGRPGAVADLPTTVRQRVSSSVSRRNLIEIGCEELEVWPLRLVDGEGKTVARVDVERVTTGASGPVTRVQLSPVRGYDAAARRLRSALDAQADLVRADDPLVALARATGTEPGRAPGPGPLPLDPNRDGSSVLAAVLERQLDIVVAFEDGVAQNLDPEVLHEFRIAIRRTRSTIRLARRLLPDRIVGVWAPEWRWLATTTSTPRDLDVLLEDLAELSPSLPNASPAAMDQLSRAVSTRRDVAQEKLVLALAGDRYGTLKRGWRYELNEFRRSANPHEGTARTLARTLIDRATKQLVEHAAVIDVTTSTDAIHDVRKRAKRLRYALDLFGELLPEGKMRVALKMAKRLQNDLGEFQDVATHREWLSRVLDSDDSLSAEATEAGRQLIAHYDTRQAELRATLEDRLQHLHASMPTR